MRVKLQGRWRGLSLQLLCCCQHCRGNLAEFTKQWFANLKHCKGDHSQCIDDKRGIESRGNAPCKGNARILTDEELAILSDFMHNPDVTDDFHLLVHNLHTSVNESLHNIFGIYHDKRVHYTDYDVLVEMVRQY